MAQRVKFSILPNTREDDYVNTLQIIYATIQSKKMNKKDFREFLSERNLWKKEDMPILFEILEISYSEPVSFGDFGRRFLEVDEEPQKKEILFFHIMRMNPILVKYVIESLDVDAGGRIHSTNELYKIISSYVYPGKYITLFDFQNWIKWIHASGAVKVVGVRWGLGEMGKRLLPKIKAIDVDEVLEEEKEEEKVEEIEECVVVEEKKIDEIPEEKEKVILKKEEVIFVEEKISELKDSEREVMEEEPLPKEMMSSEEELFENAKKIKVWWQGYPYKKTIKIETLGINQDLFIKNRDLFLYKLSFLSILHSRFEDEDKSNIIKFLNELYSLGFFEKTLDNELEILNFLKNLPSSFSDPFFLKSIELFVHLPRIKDFWKRYSLLEDAKSGREFVTHLYEKVFSPLFPLAPFYFLQIMVRLKLLPTHFESCSSIPVREVRESVFRLGFIDSVYALDFQHLVIISERLSRFFDEDTDFEESINHMKEGFGCKFRCPNIKGCSFYCREKISM